MKGFYSPSFSSAILVSIAGVLALGSRVLAAIQAGRKEVRSSNHQPDKKIGGKERRVGMFFLCLAPLFGYCASAASAVPVPDVAAAPVGTHGFPFMSTALDLSKYGYVEEEFLISGTAQAFVNTEPLASDGRWKVAPNPGVTAPYTVRVLVRRPQSAKRFNGTVLVEWMNVSGGADGAPDWFFMHPEILREGYAYVGVSAQYIGAASLQAWESGANDRYATIFHPGDSFSYDIFSQAERAVRKPASQVKPLGALTPAIKAVIATGESQSAGGLATYYNAVQPLAGNYDGFMIHSYLFNLPLSQPIAASSAATGQPISPPAGVPATPLVAVPTGAAAHVRTDLEAPVLVLQSETDVLTLGAVPQAVTGLHVQPDGRNYRIWELTGTSHGDQYLQRVGAADSAKSSFVFPLNCGNPPVNDGPHTYGARAALHALNVWVRYGWAPRPAPRFAINTAGATAFIERDAATGLALGGIRLPQIEVPIATQTGQRPLGALAATPFCILFGASDAWNGDSDPYDGQAGFDPSPTPEPVLRSLYRSRGDYLRQLRRAMLESWLNGHLRPADMPEIDAAARSVQIP